MKRSVQLGCILPRHSLEIMIKRGFSKILSKIRFVLPDRYFLMRSPGGRIYLNLRESRMMINRALGIFEYDKTRLLFNLVTPGMTIVNVGVNKGYFSLIFAKLIHDNGRVLSFEPVSDNCFWIKKSIEANNYRSIELHEYALSDKEGTENFHLGKKSGFGSFFHSPLRKNETINVKTRMLDNVLDEADIDDVDLIKIDVEGADLLVLKGAKHLLERSGNVKIVMDVDVRSVKEKIQLFEFLTSLNFRLYDITGNLKPIRKPSSIVATEEIYATKNPQVAPDV